MFVNKTSNQKKKNRRKSKPEVHPEGRIRSPRIAFRRELLPVPLGDATAMQTSGRSALLNSISESEKIKRRKRIDLLLQPLQVKPPMRAPPLSKSHVHTSALFTRSLHIGDEVVYLFDDLKRNKKLD